MSALRTAGELCTRDVVVAVRSTSLGEAARLMRERHVGCVVVVDETAEGRLVAGMITDRDIVTAVVARDVAASTLRVADVMNDEVTTVAEEASLHQAIALMRHRRVRRVPVVSSGGTLVGLLAADDLVGMLASELRALAELESEQRQLERMVRP